MRLLLTILGCGIALISVGQAPQQSLRVQITYEKAGQYLEQAVATIEAVNTVSRLTTVEYRAGRSVTLLPGFEARTGSTFSANIKPVNTGQEGDTRLQLTAFPNPFEHSTTIDYYLPADGKVNLWITDTHGKIVGQLVQDENQSAGQHKVKWRPQSVASGIYIPVVEANQEKAASRIVKK
ncbi:T9SS type A sorting domain-containing protein [Spirosoma jeollabukense]